MRQSTKQILVNVDVYPFCVEISIDDFGVIIDAALSHEDEFFIQLLEKLHEMVESNHEKIGEA